MKPVGLTLILALAALPGRGQPIDLAREIGIDQRLDEPVPLTLMFRDETGAAVPLRRYFGDKPVVLALVYYECPMLCTLVLNGMVGTFKTLSLVAGREFTVVAVSINPAETPALAAAKKQTYLAQYGRPEAAAGWHFLTGDEPAIRQLADAVGFRYAYDPDRNQFAHAAGIMIVTPAGKLARYFYGVEYPPRDVRLSLVEASRGRIGSLTDRIQLFCYHYDPKTGRYGLWITRVLQVAGGVTAIAVGLLIWGLRRGEKREVRR